MNPIQKWIQRQTQPAIESAYKKGRNAGHLDGFLEAWQAHDVFDTGTADTMHLTSFQERKAYERHPLFTAAVDTLTSLVLGTGVTYGVMDDPRAQAALEDWYALNDVENLSKTMFLQWLLDGELLTLIALDASKNEAAWLNIWDTREHPITVNTAPGNPRLINNIKAGNRTLMPEGFAWRANAPMFNKVRGRSPLTPALTAAEDYSRLMTLRMRAHEIRGRLNAVYYALVEQGNHAELKRKADRLKKLPRDGNVVTLQMDPVSGTSERLEFTNTDTRAADADSDTRTLIRTVAMIVGIPEHYLSVGDTGNRACYSTDTETLTVDGWKHHWEIADDTLIAQYNPDNERLEWVPAGPVYLADYEGDMLHFKSSVVDIMVTPDHRMYGKRARDNKADEAYEIIPADGITTNKWQFLNSAQFNDNAEVEVFTLPAVRVGNGRAILPEVEIGGDLFLEFLGYFLSEGHSGKHKRRDVNEAAATQHHYRVNLAQKKPDTVKKFQRLFDKFPIKFSETIDAEGTHRWQVTDKALCLWLLENCGSHASNKRIPEIAKNLSPRQAQILFQALMDGDGTWGRNHGYVTNGVYYSSSKQLVDDVQLLALSLGHRANVNYASMTATRAFRVQLTMNRHESMITASKNIHRVPHSGKVYCYTVPSGLFVTRRNGKVAIQGNTADSMAEPMLRRVEEHQTFLEGVLRELFQKELVRRFGRDATFTVKQSNLDRDGTRTDTLVQVPAAELSIPFSFPPVRSDEGHTLDRVQYALDADLISTETAVEALGFDPALELERKANQPDARGGDANADDPE